MELARSYTNLTRAILRFPQAPWDDALSHGQMQSKAWAIAELGQLRHQLGLVYILGGWLGTLSLLMFRSSLPFAKIRSFDIDPQCEAIADQLNIDEVIAGWRFKAVTMDMFAIHYGQHRYRILMPARPAAMMVETCTTVINTCCDHIADFARWWAMIPHGKLTLLQNNDFAEGGPDHVNTIHSLDDLIDQAPMQAILMRGTLRLPKYNRFMVIGLR